MTLNGPRADLPQRTVVFDIRQMDTLVKALRQAEKMGFGHVDFDATEVPKIRRYIAAELARPVVR